MKHIICYYSEIALKRGNRKFFEERLIKNIKKKLPSGLYSSVKRISGRILIELTEKGREEKSFVADRIKLVFGIHSFAFSEMTDQDIDNIKKVALRLIKKRKIETFKIATKRSQKSFPLSSQEINEVVGEHILKEVKGIKVSLKKPDSTCFIEVVEKNTFLSTEKIVAHGGLPIGVSGKAISLLSGGIDSPVASFLAMKRGIELIFVHFHSYPETSQASISKVKKLAKKLNEYQDESKLYLIPISKAQREISLKVNERLRVIFYRRLMFKIAERIAQKSGVKAIITGESVGQVASQTIDNMRAIEAGLDLLIIRPLVSYDKESIVKKAKEIKTFETSIIAHEDSCSRFIPRHPETKAQLKDVLEEEKKIDIESMAEESINNSEIILINKSS